MSDIPLLSKAFTNIENKLEFTVKNFGVLFPSRSKFAADVKDSWIEIKPKFALLQRQLPEKQRQLEEVGLAGSQLRLKVEVLFTYEEEFDGPWMRYQDWLTQMQEKDSNYLASREGQQKKHSKLRWLDKKLGKFFGQADTFLSSVSIIINVADPIREFKETVERFSPE